MAVVDDLGQPGTDSPAPVEEFGRLVGGCAVNPVNTHVRTNLPPFADDFFAPAAVGVAHSESAHCMAATAIF